MFPCLTNTSALNKHQLPLQHQIFIAFSFAQSSQLITIMRFAIAVLALTGSASAILCSLQPLCNFVGLNCCPVNPTPTPSPIPSPIPSAEPTPTPDDGRTCPSPEHPVVKCCKFTGDGFFCYDKPGQYLSWYRQL